MKKRLSITMLVFVCLCFLRTQNIYAQDSFCGYRESICSISISDLENFVIGGRSALEMMMSKSEKNWFVCTTEAKGRNVFLFLSYSFESYEDYAAKTEYLLGYTPVTTYGSNKTPYAENFLPNELFGFLENAFKDTNALVEVELEDILHVEDDTIEIQGHSYKGTTSVNTGIVKLLRFSDIEIKTALVEGVYNRTVWLSFKDAVDFEDEMQNRCEKSEAEFERKNEKKCTVSYSATSEEELIRKTMMILQTAVHIESEKLYDSQESVLVKKREFFDLSSIMENDAAFSYELNLSEMETTVSSIQQITEETYSKNGDIEVNNNIVYYHGDDGKVTYYYSCPFGYDEVSIITDLSKQFGRIKRTIEFRLGTGVAKEYHENLKKRFTDLLKRGNSLRIYEEEGYYCYAISYESWFISDINRFTNRILDVSNSKLHLKKHATPFLKSEIQDSLDLRSTSIGIDSKTINLKYILPNTAKMDDIVKVCDEEKCIQIEAALSYANNLQYSCFYYIKLLISAVEVLILILLSYWSVKRIKAGIALIEKRKERKSNKKEGVFCPVCGERRDIGRAFCGKCGHRF